MKPPYLSNGVRYCTLPDGTRQCTGSQMGRADILPADPSAPIKLQLRKVPFVDGCYDPGGAYFGSPANLFCAWGEDEEHCIEFYTRAKDRQEARRLVLDRIPGAKFYR